MIITDRQKEILDTIIREYVQTARPVSSQFLEQKYDFGICPASIRIEMQKLTDDGFLAQPHTSAGRVPTDKGYRLFVNELLAGDEPKPKKELDFAIGKTNDLDELFRSMQELSKNMAERSESLVIGYLSEEGVLWKEGWEEVLRQPEFTQKDLMDNFLDYLEYLEGNIKLVKPDADFKLFIGRENPYPKAREFSTFSLAFAPSERQEMIFSIVGPKRMAYDKNIALINQVIKLFGEL